MHWYFSTPMDVIPSPLLKLADKLCMLQRLVTYSCFAGQCHVVYVAWTIARNVARNVETFSQGNVNHALICIADDV